MAVFRPYQDPNLSFIPYDVRPFTRGSYTYTRPEYIAYKSEEPQNYRQDYNDPTALNSIADVLFNEAALNKHAPIKGDVEGQFDWQDIAQRVYGMGKMTYQNSIYPVVDQLVNDRGRGRLAGFGDSLSNTFGNFSETMDILANPVKAALITAEQGGDVGQAVKRAIGYGPEGRYNYDYDTGSWVANIALEIVSDPFNWVSMGGASVAKGIASTGSDVLTKAAKRIAKELSQELSDEGAQQLSRHILRNVRRNAEDLPEAVQRTLNALSKPARGRATVEVAKNGLFGSMLKEYVVEELPKTINLSALQGVQSFMNASDTVEKTLMRSIGWSSGITPTWKLASAGTHMVLDAVNNAVKRATNYAARPDGRIPLTELEALLPEVETVVKRYVDGTDLPDEAPKLYIDAIKASAIEADEILVYDALRTKSPKQAVVSLNDLFYRQTKGKMGFADYVLWLRDFAQRMPEFQNHYENMRAIKDYVEARLTGRTYKELFDEPKLGKLLKDMVEERGHEEVQDLMSRLATEQIVRRAPKKTAVEALEELYKITDFAETELHLRNPALTDALKIKLRRFAEHPLDRLPEIKVELDKQMEDLMVEFRSVREPVSDIPLSEMSDKERQWFKKAEEKYRAHVTLMKRPVMTLHKLQQLVNRYENVLEQTVAKRDMATQVTSYVFKVSQAESLMRMFTSKPGLELAAVSHDILYGTNTGKLINQLGNTLSNQPLVQKLRGQAFAHEQYRTLLNRLANDPDSAPFLANLIDAMQGFANRSFDYQFGNTEEFTRELLDQVQMQMGILAGDRNNLDYIFKTLTPERAAAFEEFVQKNGAGIELKAHVSSAYDLLRLQFLLEEDSGLARLFQGKIDLNTSFPVLYDIETTGDRIGGDLIYQISWRTFDGQHKTLNMKLPDNVYPNADVLLKVTGVDNLAEAQKMFDALRETGSLANQGAGVQEFLADIDRLTMQNNPTGSTVVKKPVMIAHNGRRFDDPFVTDVITKTRELHKFAAAQWRELPKLDTLIMQYEAQGVPIISDALYHRIREYFRLYAVSRMDFEKHWVNKPKVFEPIDSRFSDNLRALAKNVEYSDSGDTLQDAFYRSIGAELQEPKQQSLKALMETADAVDELLAGIKEENRMLYNSRVFKDNISGELRDASGVLLEMDGAWNVSQLVMRGLNKIPEIAPKIDYNTSWIHRLYPHAKELPPIFSESKLVEWSNWSRNTTDLAQNVANLPLAAQNYEGFAAFIDYGKGWLTDWYKDVLGYPLPPYIEHMTSDVLGTADRYAQAQMLYYFMERASLLNGSVDNFKEIIRSFTSDVIEILQNPHMILDSSYRPMGELFTNEFWNLNASDAMRATENYNSALRGREVYNPWKERIRNLSVVKDANNLSSATAYMQSALLRDFYDTVWQPIEELMTNIDDDVVKLEYQMTLLQHTDEKLLSDLHHVMHWPAEKLERYLWLADGTATFGTAPAMGTHQLSFVRSIKDDLFARQQELLDHHIHLEFDEGNERVWLRLDNTPEYVEGMIKGELDARRAAEQYARENGLPHPEDPWKEFYEDAPYLFAPAEPKTDLAGIGVVFEAVKKGRDLLNDWTRGKVLGTYGDLMSREGVLELQAAAPAHIRNNLIPLEAFERSEHFRSVSFNRANLGTLAVRRQINNKITLNEVKSTMNTAMSLVNVLDAQNKAAHIFFDPMHQVGGKLFEGLTPAEVKQMIQTYPEYKLGRLVTDATAKYGMWVEEIRNPTVQQIAQYMSDPNSNVTLMPLSVFTMAYETLNMRKMSGTAIGFLNKYIIGPMKAGYLSSPGFVFRNIIDSMAKNIILAGSPADAFRMVKHTLETARLYMEYKHVLRELQTFSDGVMQNTTGQFSKRILEHMYEVNPNRKISRDLFQLVHDFVEQGPSAGLSKEQQDVIERQIKENSLRKGLPLPERTLYDSIIDNPITHNVMSANSALEQVFRLSGYTWALDHGETTDQAILAIFRTHFDYSIKTRAEMFAEYVVPFASFSINNTKFWLDAIDNIGWVASLFRDIYTPIWNLDEETEEEMEYNRSLQYNILAGNIRFDNNLTIKLSPSVLDAVKILGDPSEAVGRIAAYIRIPTEMLMAWVADDEEYEYVKNLMSNIPMIGPLMYRQWDAFEWLSDRIRGGSAEYHHVALDRIDGPDAEKYTSRLLAILLPSIFGTVAGGMNWNNDWDKLSWIRKTYTKKYFPHTYKQRKIKKASKSYARKTFARKAYSKKIFAKNPSTFSVQWKVRSTARGHQMRMPGANANPWHVSPGLMRRLYTGKGKERFKSRMIPVTSRNLAARLRSDWAFLR